MADEPAIADTPTQIEKAFAWLVDHSDGVVGLNINGSVMPWEEVLHKYVPYWSGGFADHELDRELYGEPISDGEDDDDA